MIKSRRMFITGGTIALAYLLSKTRDVGTIDPLDSTTTKAGLESKLKEELIGQPTQKGFYSQNNQLIYAGDFEDALGDNALIRETRIRILGNLKDSNEFGPYEKINATEFTRLKSVIYIKPLSKKLNIDYIKGSLKTLQKEFDSFGIQTHFSNVPMRSLQDIKKIGDGITPIYAVEDLGLKVDGSLVLHFKDGSKRHTDFEIDFSQLDTNISQLKVEDNRFVLKANDVFIKAGHDDYETFSGLYAGIMHQNLVNEKIKILESLSNIRKEGDDFIIANYQDARNAAELTDEAVVHGLFHNWLLAKSPLKNDKSIIRRVIDNELRFRYKGASVIRARIRNLSQSQSPEAVLLNDYRRNPLFYRNLILQGTLPDRIITKYK